MKAINSSLTGSQVRNSCAVTVHPFNQESYNSIMLNQVPKEGWSNAVTVDDLIYSSFSLDLRDFKLESSYFGNDRLRMIFDNMPPRTEAFLENKSRDVTHI